MTAEGLVIELIDSNDEPLFDLGNSNPSPLLTAAAIRARFSANADQRGYREGFN